MKMILTGALMVLIVSLCILYAVTYIRRLNQEHEFKNPKEIEDNEDDE